MENNPGGECVGGIDVCDASTVRKLFQDYGDENTTVWNLAAPLSVETAMNPEVAEAVTIGGMKNTISAMRAVGARRICFTDSIGSFGASSPRVGNDGALAHENPTQDPGSDYGRQKRAVRDMMAEFEAKDNGDSRVAVLPGVLHASPCGATARPSTRSTRCSPRRRSWGEAARTRARSTPTCIPMVFVDDLMRGLMALHARGGGDAHRAQKGYCVPGALVHRGALPRDPPAPPRLQDRVELDENMNKFANLWPDSSPAPEPLRDLDYRPQVDLAGAWCSGCSARTTSAT